MIYKIIVQRHILYCAVLVFFYLSPYAQDLYVSKYGVTLLNKTNQYIQTVDKDSLKKMLELKRLIPNVIYDLRYAGTNNFMHRRMYPKSTKYTFLRLSPARALASVQQDLNTKGYGLKIFDAYRPYSVTVTFWELVKDERYVADPAKGSGHNRGLAVDLTIIDLKTDRDLDMGTGFDNFTDSSHHSFTNLPETVMQNRKLLKDIMLKHGFQLFETEWWHYFWPDDRQYEVLDLDFKQIKKARLL